MQRFATFVLTVLALAAFLSTGALAETNPAPQKAACCAAHAAAAKAADAPAKAQTVGCVAAEKVHHACDPASCDPATCDPATCSHAHCDPAKCDHAKGVAAVKAKAEPEVKAARSGCNPAACNPAACRQAATKPADAQQQKTEARSGDHAGDKQKI